MAARTRQGMIRRKCELPARRWGYAAMKAVSALVLLAAPLVSSTSQGLLVGNCSLPTQHVRIDGYDIGPKRAAKTPDVCCVLCASEPKCKAFCWVNPTTCWLKTAAANPHSCEGCVAGYTSVLPPAPPHPHPPPPPPVLPGCVSDADCNGGGKCAAKKCECSRGWAGEHCERINFGVAYACGVGGLCLNHTHARASIGSAEPNYSDNFTSTWGGDAVQADDGSYHMYAASFGKDEALGSWLANSRVVHAIAQRPQGPYKLVDVALGPREPTAWDGFTQHNPAIQRDPVSGTYLLFYMGSTQNGTVTMGGGRCSDHPEHQSLCNQRVGLATATNPGGPWKRLDKPILDVGKPGSWDDQFTTNPTPLALKNGSVLLLYKARSRADFNKMSTGVAFAQHW